MLNKYNLPYCISLYSVEHMAWSWIIILIQEEEADAKSYHSGACIAINMKNKKRRSWEIGPSAVSSHHACQQELFDYSKVTEYMSPCRHAYTTLPSTRLQSAHKAWAVRIFKTLKRGNWPALQFWYSAPGWTCDPWHAAADRAKTPHTTGSQLPAAAPGYTPWRGVFLCDAYSLALWPIAKVQSQFRDALTEQNWHGTGSLAAPIVSSDKISKGRGGNEPQDKATYTASNEAFKASLTSFANTSLSSGEGTVTFNFLTATSPCQ